MPVPPTVKAEIFVSITSLISSLADLGLKQIITEIIIVAAEQKKLTPLFMGDVKSNIQYKKAALAEAARMRFIDIFLRIILLTIQNMKKSIIKLIKKTISA